MRITRTRPDKWLPRQPAADSRARLFCIPYSGCGAGMYRDWPAQVDGVAICPVQLPGRENRMREPLFTSYESLADEIIEGLLPHLDRPFGFFGHCSSALAAYEVTQRLARRGLPVPTRLFVSSQVAPHRSPHGRFLDLSRDELRLELVGLMQGLGAEPLPGLIDLALEILESDIAVNRRYRVAGPAPLPCPVTAVGWTRDAEIPADLLGDWSDYGPTSFELLDGEHYAFIKAPSELLDLFVRDLLPPVGG